MENVTNTCTKCKNASTLDTRYIQCTRKALIEDNNGSDSKSFFVDSKIWMLSLCDDCKKIGYKNYLGITIEKSSNSVKGTIILFIVLVLLIGVCVLGLYTESFADNIEGYTRFIAIIALIGLVVDIIAIPIVFLKHLNNNRILSVFTNNEVIPIHNVDKAFIGEAEAILTTHKDLSDEFKLEYPLPNNILQDEFFILKKFNENQIKTFKDECKFSTSVEITNNISKTKEEAEKKMNAYISKMENA